MKNNSEEKILWYGFVALIIAFVPIALTNYMGDDMAFSIGLHNPDFNIWKFAIDVFKTWWVSTGRITILAYLAIGFSFGIIKSLIVYKTYLILCNLLMVCSLLYMCKGLGLKKQHILLLIFCLISTIQIRGSSDPYSTFHGLMPLCTALIFISIGCFLEKRTVLSLVAFVGASLFYEVGYLVLPIVLILLATNKNLTIKSKIFCFIPYVMILMCMLVLNVAGKYYGTHVLGLEPNYAYTLSLTPSKMVDVIAKQMIGSMPLNYLFLTDRSGNSGIDIKTNKILWFTLLTVVPLFPIYIYRYKSNLFEYNEFLGLKFTFSKIRTMALIGLVLWVAPGAFLSVSAKYQDIIRWSQPYVTNYLSSIGFSLIIFALILKMCSSANPTLIRIGQVLTWVTVYLAIVTTGYNYYNAFLLRTAWSGQDFIKNLVWDNEQYSVCTNNVYSDKWKYWEEKLFGEKYKVVDKLSKNITLDKYDCAVFQDGNNYIFMSPSNGDRNPKVIK